MQGQTNRHNSLQSWKAIRTLPFLKEEIDQELRLKARWIKHRLVISLHKLQR